MIFQAHQTIVFAGDSITDAGRRLHAAPYGEGYMNQARCLLTARYPELGLRLHNRGIGGDTTRNLMARWNDDVLRERPDWLSVMIGINDVWRGFGDRPHEAVPLPEYTATLRDLLREASAGGARLILMTPYMIEPNREQAMRRQMDRYGAAVREIAAELGAVFVNTQAAFDAALQSTTPADWAADQIHPNGAGHAIIALAWLRAVGFEL